MPVSLPALLLALVITFLGSIVQGTIGFGMAMVSVPILSMVDPVLAPVPQLIIALPMTVAMFWRERRHVDYRGLSWVAAGRLLGVPIGLFLLGIATQQTLNLMIGLAVLFAVTVVGFGLHIPRTPTTSVIAGTAAGVAGLVASVGGPPMALIYRNEEGAMLRSSLAGIMFFGILINIAGRAFGGYMGWDEVIVGLLLLPAMVLGLWASRLLHGRVEGAPLQLAILVVAAGASIGLVIRALL